MEIQFTIKGNQENSEENPIPYKRSTQNMQWRKDVKRYEAWKKHVRDSLIAWDFKDKSLLRAILNNQWSFGKPLVLEENKKAMMSIIIYWAKENHGDPDNIWKGIADALFVNDKNVDGSFASSIAGDGKGRVDITILFYGN